MCVRPAWPMLPGAGVQADRAPQGIRCAGSDTPIWSCRLYQLVIPGQAVRSAWRGTVTVTFANSCPFCNLGLPGDIPVRHYSLSEERGTRFYLKGTNQSSDL